MLITGYNLVRGHAVSEFRDAYERRFHIPRPEVLSAISFLRHLQREQPLPHKVVEVTGFPDLWRVCQDADGLARLVYRLFASRMNWLQNLNPYIYFVLPETATFSSGQHLSIRLSSGLYADMTAVFGHLTAKSSDHYHHEFTMSSV